MTMMIRIVTILLSMVPSVEKEATARRLEGRKLEGKRREVERRTRGKKKKNGELIPKKNTALFFPLASLLYLNFSSRSRFSPARRHFAHSPIPCCRLAELAPRRGSRERPRRRPQRPPQRHNLAAAAERRHASCRRRQWRRRFRPSS